MVTKLKPITLCRVCSSTNLVRIINLGNLHLSDFTNGVEKPARFPLMVVLCKSCCLLQLKHNSPTSLLYGERYGYKSGINQTMKNELREIVLKSINKLGKRKKQIVAVDIGANDGTLLSFYPKTFFRVGIDPIKKFAKECKRYANIVITDFFSFSSYQTKFHKEKKADIVTAISCFYDMENPNKFIADVKKILDKNGLLVIQQNYLVKMLTQNAFDNIVHEHLEYYSLTSLQNLLARHGLEVFDLELRDLNGGSYRTYICYKSKYSISNIVHEQMEVEKLMSLHRKKTYADFAKRIKSIKSDVYSFIQEETRKGKKVYLYGASTRGNTLLQYFGLDNKLIKKAVEKNPEKWGKKIASVGIPIISEKQARYDKPDYMLVLPWFFKEEFIKREEKYLRSGGHFIFPLPRLKIV